MRKRLFKKIISGLIFSGLIFLLFYFIFLEPKATNIIQAQTEPQINSAPASVQHKQSITISGSGFGTKNPAAPLVWDDAETGNAPTEKFTSTRPRIGESVPKYYTTASLGRNEPQVHALSNRYIVGRHWQSGSCSYESSSGCGSIMLLTGDKANEIKNSFISYYYKLDSNYPDCCKDGVCGDECPDGICGSGECINGICADELPNHKTENFGVGYDSIYDGGMSVAAYYWGAPKPKCDSGANYKFYTNTGYPTYESNHWGSPSVPFNRGQWVKRMIALDSGVSQSNPGIFEASVLNGQNSFSAGTFSEKIWVNPDGPIHTIAVGGFERYYCNKGNTMDSFRYFDDVYIDKTFARAVLTDNANYTKSTIIEPRIPSAWSDSSITVGVNQGKLPQGTAYLYVIDADGNVNASGYPVTIGSGGAPDTTPPSVPSGVTVQ